MEENIRKIGIAARHIPRIKAPVFSTDLSSPTPRCPRQTVVKSVAKARKTHMYPPSKFNPINNIEAISRKNNTPPPLSTKTRTEFAHPLAFVAQFECTRSAP